MFIIEDERHAEQFSQFSTFDEAVAELKRRSKIPWDQSPNVAPCTSWETCGREYSVVEFDDSWMPWNEVQRVSVLNISAPGVIWSEGFEES